MFTLVMVNFSFQGTELVGIAAGESENPEKTLPKSIRNVIWRTLFFFVLAMFILVAILPYKTAGSLKARLWRCSIKSASHLQLIL